MEYNQDELPDPSSSLQEIKDFVDTSLIWKDLKIYLEWKMEKDQKSMLAVDNLQDLGKLQGSIEAIEDVLMLPDLFLHLVEFNEPIEDNA
jgi:hypothetical protein